MSFLRLLVLAVFAMAVPSALAVPELSTAPTTTAETGPLAIRVLSNRADLISGGDALVQIVMPERRRCSGSGRRSTSTAVTSAPLRLARRTAATSDSSTASPSGRTSSPPSSARTAADHDHEPSDRRPDLRRPAGAAVVLHDGTRTGSGRRPTRSATRRRPSPTSTAPPSRGQFSAYDPASPPLDLATTTTDQGVTVPYIVRVERGTMDRGIYDIAVLSTRAGPAPQALEPQARPARSARARRRTTSSRTPTTVLDDNALVARLHGREQLAQHPGQEREQRRHRRER